MKWTRKMSSVNYVVNYSSSIANETYDLFHHEHHRGHPFLLQKEREEKCTQMMQAAFELQTKLFFRRTIPDISKLSFITFENITRHLDGLIVFAC
jgi:hypothetical protein